MSQVLGRLSGASLRGEDVRADLAAADGSTLLVASPDVFRRFLDAQEAYRWLQPFAADRANMAALRRALGDASSSIFIRRLTDDQVLRAVARIVARSCLAIDIGLLAGPPTDADTSDGASDAADTPASLTEMAETESTYEELEPEPVLPPEFPRLARREAEFLQLQTRIMAVVLDLMRFVGEKTVLESVVAESLVSTARGGARGVQDNAGDLGNVLAGIAADGAFEASPSAIAAEFARSGARVARRVLAVADRTGSVLSGLGVGPVDVEHRGSQTASTLRDASGRAARRVMGAEADITAGLAACARPPAPHPARRSQVAPIYAAVADAQRRVLEQVSRLEPATERLTRALTPWRGVPLAPWSGSPRTPAPEGHFGRIVMRRPGPDASDGDLSGLLRGAAVVVAIEVIDAEPGAGIIVSFTADDGSLIAERIVHVPPADDLEVAPLEPAHDRAGVVELPWSIPSDVAVGTRLGVQVRYRWGRACAQSVPLPIVETFDFGDASHIPAIVEARPLPRPDSPTRVALEIDDIDPARPVRVRWAVGDDHDDTLSRRLVGDAGPVSVVIEAEGVTDGTGLDVEVLDADTGEVIDRLGGVIDGGRWSSRWHPPGRPIRLLLSVAVHGRDAPVRGPALSIHPSFPFGDGQPTADPLGPPNPRIGPATDPAVDVVDRSIPLLSDARWAHPSDPNSVLSRLPAGAPASLSLVVESMGLPDGTRVVFSLEGPPGVDRVEVRDGAVVDGRCCVTVRLPALARGAIRFSAADAAGAVDAATSNVLRVVPVFAIGDAQPSAALHVPYRHPAPARKHIEVVDRVRPALANPRWTGAAGPDERLTAVGLEARLLLRCDVRAARPDTGVRFTVHAGDGLPPTAQLVGRITNGIAEAAFTAAPADPGPWRFVVELDGDESAVEVSPLLERRPGFAVGDAPTGPRGELPVHVPAPPARSAIDTVDASPVTIERARWHRSDDTPFTAELEQGAEAPVWLSVDVGGMPDGAGVKFDVARLGSQRVIATLGAQLVDGRATARWTPGSDVIGALRFVARIAPDGPAATSPTLEIRPPFTVGDTHGPMMALAEVAKAARAPMAPIVVDDTPRAELVCAGWRRPADRARPLFAVDGQAGDTVEIRLETAGVPDGAEVDCEVHLLGAAHPPTVLKGRIEADGVGLAWRVPIVSEHCSAQARLVVPAYGLTATTHRLALRPSLGFGDAPPSKGNP